MADALVAVTRHLIMNLPIQSSGFRFPFEFKATRHPKRIQLCRDAVPTLLEAGQLGQHVVLSLPQDSGCDVIASLPDASHLANWPTDQRINQRKLTLSSPDACAA